MTSEATQLRSGKGHRDENFPVASWLISAEHRGIILAFYNYVRTADDIADHATLRPTEKLRLLDRLEASLLGKSSDEPPGVALREALARRGLPSRHAEDLLAAFRMDVTKLRYQNWDDLIGYCRYSAMPVGRFVLDVHGESRATWPANDAVCAALQINNHLQDCAADYRNLDRVYVPLDALASAGARVDDLGRSRASPNLRRCLNGLAARTAELLDEGRGFAASIADWRLSLEVSVIQSYADRIVAMLATRDPLSEPVHLSKAQFTGYGLIALMKAALQRLRTNVAAATSQKA
jgi:hydroxysqualene synthase